MPSAPASPRRRALRALPAGALIASVAASIRHAFSRRRVPEVDGLGARGRSDIGLAPDIPRTPETERARLLQYGPFW